MMRAVRRELSLAAVILCVNLLAACTDEFNIEEDLVRNMIDLAYEDAEKTSKIFQ